MQHTTELDTTTTDTDTEAQTSKRPLRRLLAIVAVALASFGGVVSGISPLAPTQAAGADLLISNYFSLDAKVKCYPNGQDVWLTIDAGTPPAYYGMQARVGYYFGTNGQYVWSGWSNTTRLYSHQQVISSVIKVGYSADVRAKVYLSYWTGSGWTTPQGTWATRSQAGYLWNGTGGLCHT